MTSECLEEWSLDIAYSDDDIVYSDYEPLIKSNCTHYVDITSATFTSNSVTVHESITVFVGTTTAEFTSNEVTFPDAVAIVDVTDATFESLDVSIVTGADIDAGVTTSVFTSNDSVASANSNIIVTATSAVFTSNDVLVYNVGSVNYEDTVTTATFSVNSPTVAEILDANCFALSSKCRFISMPVEIYLDGVHSPNLSFSDRVDIYKIIRVIQNET